MLAAEYFACAQATAYNPKYSGNQKDIQREQQSLKKYLLNPNDGEAFSGACSYYCRMKRFAQLKDFCAEAMHRHPDWALPHFYLARVAQQMLDDKTQLREYSVALRKDPNFPQTYCEYSDLLRRNGRRQEAMSIARDGLRRFGTLPKHDQPCFFLRLTIGRSLIDEKQYKEAIPVLEEAAALSTNIEVPEVEDYLCEAYIKTKQFDKAVKELNKALQKYPYDDECILMRAQANAELNRNEAALQDATNFLKRQPSKDSMNYYSRVNLIVTARKLRAQSYDRLGKHDMAEKERAAIKASEQELFDGAYFRADEDRKRAEK